MWWSMLNRLNLLTAIWFILKYWSHCKKKDASLEFFSSVYIYIYSLDGSSGDIIVQRKCHGDNLFSSSIEFLITPLFLPTDWRSIESEVELESIHSWLRYHCKLSPDLWHGGECWGLNEVEMKESFVVSIYGAIDKGSIYRAIHQVDVDEIPWNVHLETIPRQQYLFDGSYLHETHQFVIRC